MDCPGKYQITEQYLNQNEKVFEYHESQADQPDRYKHLRALAKNLAASIYLCCPPSREQSVALTKLEEVIMWANAAIARNES